MNAANPAVGGTILDELANLPDRLKAAAQDVEDAYERVKLALKVRNRLIVKAVDDARISQRQVAGIVGVSQPQVIRILSQSDGDDD